MCSWGNDDFVVVFGGFFVFSHLGSMHGAVAGTAQIAPDAIGIRPAGGLYVKSHATDRIDQFCGLSGSDNFVAIGHELLGERFVEIEIGLRGTARKILAGKLGASLLRYSADSGFRSAFSFDSAGHKEAVSVELIKHRSFFSPFLGGF